MMCTARERNAFFGKLLKCLIVLASLSALLYAQDSSGAAASSTSAAPIRATHVLGFEGLAKNAQGTLTVENGALQFRKSGGPAVQVAIVSIQNVSVGSEDKQVGGVPMTLGKAAVPFGGGRAISLVSHKKYDTLTLEYLDAGGGFHGAIFQMAKGQGQILRSELIRQGAHVSSTEGPASQQNSPGANK